MSKSFRTFNVVSAAVFLILQLFNISTAQDIEARLSLAPGPDPFVRVDGRFLSGDRPNKRSISFLREFAGVGEIANRIRSLTLTDVNGKTVLARTLMPGEYDATTDLSGWSFDIALTPPKKPLSRAHISWIDDNRGILMLGDILPLSARQKASARVAIELPAGWEVMSTESLSADHSYNVNDVDNAVFMIAKTGVARSASTSNLPAVVTMLEDWRFSPADASQAANDAFRSYASIIGRSPVQNFQVFLLRLPAGTPAGVWEGDTRGNTITILSSDMPFASQSRQRLFEQFRHEVFHLWFPNGVNLGGSYDWFYEGFALYASLKTGVAANQLSFDNFLDTLARAYDIERSVDPLSLIDASKQRWAGENSAVYARGMLTAFVVDVELLTHSSGRRSVETLLRDIYQRHGISTPRVDGNEAVLARMRQYPELNTVIDKFIIGSDRFTWSDALSAAAIDSTINGPHTTLNVRSGPNRRQKDLLDRLGYNSWRKLSR